MIGHKCSGNLEQMEKHLREQAIKRENARDKDDGSERVPPKRASSPARTVSRHWGPFQAHHDHDMIVNRGSGRVVFLKRIMDKKL